MLAGIELYRLMTNFNGTVVKNNCKMSADSGERIIGTKTEL